MKPKVRTGKSAFAGGYRQSTKLSDKDFKKLNPIATGRGGTRKVPMTLAEVGTNWYCDPCAVVVRERRCPHCGKLEQDLT